MRRTLARSAVAAIVVAAVVVPGAQPAHANNGSFLDPVTQIYTTLAGPGQPAQKVSQVVTAVAAIRPALLASLNQIPTAAVRTCATRHVTELATLTQLSPSAAQAWAADATACLTLINSHLQAAQVLPPQPAPNVNDAKPLVDQLGLAVNVVGPIAITARLHTGAGYADLRTTLTTANNTVLTKIAPWCSEGPVYEDDSNVFELWFVCWAYNYGPGVGHGEAFQLWYQPCDPWFSCETYPISPPVDKDKVRAEANKHTSWVIARAALPLI